jgi:Do/DeqQ family serine protease
MGSGFVIDTKGNIVTNNHVVEGADEVKVTFADGKTVPGKVVGTDPKSDIAVIRVEGVAGLKPARFGDSDKMEVGEWTIAIGNPMGLDHTVTVGVLSAKGRSGFGMTQYEDFLQTDASINPGNSGGPLINLDGEVIGINTMIRGIGTGLNFAVPSSMAKPIAEQLIGGGKVHRPYIGIQMQDMTPEMARALGKSSPEKGAIVGTVQLGSPAAKAGVHMGDVIVRVDNTKTDNSKMVQTTILRKQIGQKVELAVWRDGKEEKLAVTTAELPNDMTEAQHGNAGENGSHAKLGIALQSLTPQLAERLNLPKGTKGALIGQVRQGSPGEEAGLQQGDVIVEVDRKPVHGAEDAAAALNGNREGGHMVRIQRGEGALFLVIP